MRLTYLATWLMALTPLSCTLVDDEDPQDDDSSDTGGAASGDGGSSTSTGGSGASTGGELATGGFLGTGGQLATGGDAGTGGQLATGGDAGTGGQLATGGDAGTGGSASADVPGTAHCAPVAEWDAAWVAIEEQILVLANQHRAAGADCGSEGTFGPASPVTMDPALRCAARLHSDDMATRDFFSHGTWDASAPVCSSGNDCDDGEVCDNADGGPDPLRCLVGPGPRLDAAGYSGWGWGENIYFGPSAADSIVTGWMNSDGHCANIMNPSFTVMGIGFASGSGDWSNYTTMTCGQ